MGAHRWRITVVDKHDPDDAAAWGWEGEWWMSIWVDLPVAERFLPNQKVEASIDIVLVNQDSV